MDYSFKQQQENPGPLGQTSSGAEIDEFKRMLIDTNPVLLATTFIVCGFSRFFKLTLGFTFAQFVCLLTIPSADIRFEFLAFKNGVYRV